MIAPIIALLLTQCPPQSCGKENTHIAFQATGPFATETAFANHINDNLAPFCVTFNTHATGSGWTDTGTFGVMNFGAPFAGANGFNLYRTSSANTCFWIAKLYNSAGTLHTINSASGAIYPYGRCSNTDHVVAFCVEGTSASWWVDGVQRITGSLTGTFNWSAAGRVASLGSNQFPYGSANPLDRVCVVKGTNNTGNISVDVPNSCGQFTVRSVLAPQYACHGCLNETPAVNALTVYTAGDSLTAGSGVALPRPYPAKLNALLGGGYTVTNGGVSGYTVAQMKTAYEATGRNFNRCVFLGGINNIFVSGNSAASTYTTASALLDEMRTDGCRPIVLLPTPACNTGLGWTAPKQTEYESYRTLLAGYCSTYPSTTTCIETYTSLGDSTTCGSVAGSQGLATAYNADNTHQNQAGADVLANLAFGAFP